MEASITNMIMNPNEEWLNPPSNITKLQNMLRERTNVGISSNKIFTITCAKYPNVKFLRGKHNACTVWTPENPKTRRIYIGISTNIYQLTTCSNLSVRMAPRGAHWWGIMSWHPLGPLPPNCSDTHSNQPPSIKTALPTSPGCLIAPAPAPNIY